MDFWIFLLFLSGKNPESIVIFLRLIFVMLELIWNGNSSEILHARPRNDRSVLCKSRLLDKSTKNTNNNHNIYYTTYLYIQEIHGGACSVSRIEYLTDIVEFETIHTEDLPSDWIIRLGVKN